MAKAPTSVIGIDLGHHSLKAVLMQRRGDRHIITHYATRTLDEPATEASHVARELKALLKELGGTSKNCAVAVSSPDAILRIIQQPETPPEILRDALRLNGMALLNQDCRSFVLDCDHIPTPEDDQPVEPGTQRKLHYLVGGVPRTEVTRIAQAIDEAGIQASRMQLAPISTFNAFEFAHPEIFNERAFFLVDIGYNESTVLVGAKRELVLVRNIDFGGRMLMETLMALSGEPQQNVIDALEQEDELMIENARMALMVLTREIGSSIGFFEGRRDSTIDRVFVSGGPAKSRAVLKVMTEEAHLPCEAWNAIEACEVTIAPDLLPQFKADAVDLTVACGIAAETLNGN